MGYTVEDLVKSNEFSGIKIINNLYETNREIPELQAETGNKKISYFL